MKAIKKTLSFMLSRLVITVVLILLQMGLIAFYLIKLADYGGWVQTALIIGSLSMVLFVIWRDDNPAYKMGWIMLLCLFPILGGTMYFFFGNKRPAKSLKKKLEPQEEEHWKDIPQSAGFDSVENTRLRETMGYVSAVGKYPAWDNSRVDYFPSGERMYVKILEDLKKAEKFIFVEFFIINSGKMWDGIFQILREKVKEGVEVRLIYDDVGSIRNLPKRFYADMKEAGIEILTFNPLKPFASLIYNNRDHRKIIVVDGDVAYSGGINIADEYINEEKRFGYWKDSGIRVEGDAVWNFSVMFLNMWNAFKKTEDSYDRFRPSETRESLRMEKGMVQPYADTPLDDENLGENVYLEIINCARKYVYIFTPYLVIDNEMMTALRLAAKRGVDVRIVTPGIPDKKLIFRLTRSYYRPLIRAGVKIYEFTPGFVHAKSFIADDKIGVVGTINMDYRSLFLHFECATLMVECRCLQDLKEDCLETMDRSKLIELKDSGRRGFIGLMIDSILRAMSPLL